MGFHPNTVYDVRVRGWLGDKPGDWKIREKAFHTKQAAKEDDQPDEGGDEGQTIGKPGEIKVGEVGEHAAVIGWAKPETPGDAKFFYDVQLRKRINGKPTDWQHAMETAHNEVALKELASGTVYEVRVRAWVNKKPSAWQIKEEAFKTKGEQTKDDGQAGTPQIGWIKADDIGPRAGVAKWSLVRELDVKVGYDVQIRIRIEGKAGEWKHEAETAKNSIIIDGLKPDTLYEIRVRPWANKKAGNWKVLENAFKTRKAEDDGDGDGDDGEGEKEDGGEHETGESPKAPSQPGVIKVSKVTPNSALIHWGASKVPGETKAVYDCKSVSAWPASRPSGDMSARPSRLNLPWANWSREPCTRFVSALGPTRRRGRGRSRRTHSQRAEGRGNKPSTTPVMLIFKLFPAAKCASLGQQGKAASSWSPLTASAVQSGRPLIFARFRFPK